MTDILTPPLAGFTGTVITPENPDYDERRAVWNGTVDERPAAIARCATTADVVNAINAVRDAGLPFAIRGGGHSVAGLSSCDGGVVIDLSGMRSVEVDAPRQRASVAPGATWHDVDAATGAHGLATPGGLVSTTGVAGLTLGGGIGWLQRRYGLACDNLVAAEIVTASAEIVGVSVSEHPGLLWGLRGGGGNFGVVSRFEFALHPVATILGGLMLFPLSRGGEVLAAFRDWAADAPDEATLLASIMTGPPEPFVPPELEGKKVVALVGCWCGALDEGATALAPLRALGPAVDLFGPMPYPALQGMLDGSAPPGIRNYFRGGYLDELDDEVIAVVLEHGARLPSPMSAIHLHQMGGAVARVVPGATAFSGRDAAYTYNLVSTWIDRDEDALHIDANRAAAAALAPLSLPGSYVNFLTDAGRAVRAYGDDIYDRLAILKREWDPHNLFVRNHNVIPAL